MVVTAGSRLMACSGNLDMAAPLVAGARSQVLSNEQEVQHRTTISVGLRLAGAVEGATVARGGAGRAGEAG